MQSSSEQPLVGSRYVTTLIGTLSMQRFLAMDGHRKCTVFLLNLSSHHHIYIFKSLCATRDDNFENLGETNVLACKMFTSGYRPWLKNVACLSSLLTAKTNFAGGELKMEKLRKENSTYVLVSIREKS